MFLKASEEMNQKYNSRKKKADPCLSIVSITFRMRLRMHQTDDERTRYNLRWAEE